MDRAFRWIMLALCLLSFGACATSQDRAAYHQAQVDAIKAQVEARMLQKPMIELTGMEGSPIVVSGLKSLKVYAPGKNDQEFLTVKQYQDEYLPVYLSALNLMGIPVALGVQGYFFNEALKSVNPGNNVIYGQGNSGVQGGSANVMASPGGAGAHTGQQGSAVGSNAPSTVETITVPAQ